MAVWVGGKHVAAGEEIFAEVQKAFFGPFRVSVMLDSNGCNTTAATTIARIAKERDLVGLPRGRARPRRRRPAVGRAAAAGGLRGRRWPRSRPTCSTTIAPIAARAASRSRSELGLDVREPADRGELEALLDGAQIVLSAGPAGVQVLRRDFWAQHPTIELLADYNAAEPLGIEGTKATDDMADYDGKLVLGALAIGGPKMKVHKACVRRLFECNDQVLDTDAVYAIAKELV